MDTVRTAVAEDSLDQVAAVEGSIQFAIVDRSLVVVVVEEGIDQVIVEEGIDLFALVRCILVKDIIKATAVCIKGMEPVIVEEDCTIIASSFTLKLQVKPIQQPKAEPVEQPQLHEACTPQ